MSETIFATVVASLVVSIITFFVLQLRKRYNLAHGTIRLKLRQSLPDQRIRLVVRHVRNGKDEVDDKCLLLNEDIEFSRSKCKDDWVATLNYSKNLGFQFKCYVDYPSGKKEEVLTFLESNGFIGVSPDGTYPNRLWFLLPKISKCKTVDHYINNYYHSRIIEIVHEA